MKPQSTLFIDSVVRSGATFSPCGKYRYLLWRHFTGDAIGRMLNMVLLNPSTATAEVNDPTVSRCCERAKSWGFDSLFVTNIFAWRSTNPSVLTDLQDPVGPENDDVLVSSAKSAAMVVCGWGNHGK